jgi:hypothetical protein
MLPKSTQLEYRITDYERDTYGTKTFKLNTDKNVIAGMTDGLESLKQSIYLRLNTEADQHIMYPYTYGLQTLDLIGKSVHYVMAVIQGRITETLLKDDRIINVTNFEFLRVRNALHVGFLVETVYGYKINAETVVNY